MIGKCLICGSYTLPGRVVCSSCLTMLNYNCFDSYMVRCKTCLYPLLDHVYSCPRCKALQGVRILSLFDYRNIKLRHLLECYKFRGMKKYSLLFAFIISIYLEKNNLVDCTIVPVPCSSAALKRRGWDHMKEVAKILEKRYGYSVSYLLTNRDVSAEEQKKLGLKSRIQASKHRFAVAEDVSSTVGRVVIIDDICTTGMTLRSCSSVLKDAGCKNVMALTVFAEM